MRTRSPCSRVAASKSVSGSFCSSSRLPSNQLPLAVGMTLPIVHRGEVEMQLRASGTVSLQRERTAAVVCDLAREIEAEAGSFSRRARGEERVEDLVRDS